MLVYNTLFSRILQEGNAYFLENFYRGLNPALSCTGGPGCSNCVSGFALTGRLLFLHRLTGALELPQAGSPLTGGKFFAEPQREIRRRCGGSVPRPAAGAKRKDNLRFSFLFELLPFPCLLIRRRLPTCDRSEMGYGRGFFLPCLSQPVRSVRYITATQTGKSLQARHNNVARFFSAL